ncbi:hypothetical protein ACEWY4_000220 [Coilia grayii]|uniref:SWIM-type domain-containing protein n=1 Tax=Coilia grayii TaxID=363190 RepID=A0ABD1KW23_9TELE
MDVNWVETAECIRGKDGKLLPHPKLITEWVDDMRRWPPVTYGDIFNYLVLSVGIDGFSMRNFKSTEAYQYLHSGKVGRVLLDKQDNLLFLKASVSPSQASCPSHSAWVLVTTEGVVETTGCSCIAGLGKSCSHAAAILWKVENAVSNGLTGVASTDEQRIWNTGTQQNLAPKLLVDIAFSHHKPTDAYQTPEVRPNLLPLPPTPIFHTHDELRNGLKHLKLPQSSLLFKCVNATVSQEPPQASAEVHAVHDGTSSCQRCGYFYETFVAFSPETAKTLEQLTREQTASHLWHDSRKVRITASTAKKVPVRANPLSFLQHHIHPRFHGNEATRHGVAGEVLAVQWLEECGFTVARSGTVLCPSEPWLSASPDGFLNTGELLEVKCPLLKENEDLQDALSRCDMKMVDGLPQLQPNGSRGFYTQVQLGLFCTRLRGCKLLVWSASKQILFDVPYDETFCVNTIARLRSFYFKHMLPYLADEYQEGRLLMCDRYMHLCK